MLAKTPVLLLSLLARIVVAVPAVLPGQGCVINVGLGGNAGGTKITIINVIRTKVIVFPIIINTFVRRNTSLKYNGGKLATTDLGHDCTC